MREIYFAQCGDRIKIGISVNPSARIEQLRQGAGSTVTLIASVAGDFSIERALHKKLRQHRIDREWYRDHSDVRAAIQNCINLFPAPNAREQRKRSADKFKAVCKILWPEKTADALAEIAGTDRRSGTRWLSGESDVPAVVIAAVIVELVKR